MNFEVRSLKLIYFRVQLTSDFNIQHSKFGLQFYWQAALDHTLRLEQAHRPLWETILDKKRSSHAQSRSGESAKTETISTLPLPLVSVAQPTTNLKFESLDDYLKPLNIRIMRFFIIANLIFSIFFNAYSQKEVRITINPEEKSFLIESLKTFIMECDRSNDSLGYSNRKVGVVIVEIYQPDSTHFPFGNILFDVDTVLRANTIKFRASMTFNPILFVRQCLFVYDFIDGHPVAFWHPLDGYQTYHYRKRKDPFLKVAQPYLTEVEGAITRFISWSFEVNEATGETRVLDKRYFRLNPK